MVKKGFIKRVFPGGNTAKGFFSYYDNIIGTEATRIFIIKGGPGVGKSSFMKKIGCEMAEKGYDVEFHQCSSDNGSLDGIVIPELKIAIIDGTAPHVVDPKHPGGIDEILNFGEFWDEDGMRKNREQIVAITTKLGKLYKRAYRFIAAAKSIRDDMEAIYKEALDKGKLNLALTKLKAEVLAGVPYMQKEGKTRHLFGSAYAPGGVIDYYETIVETMEKIIYINSSYVEGTSLVLEEIVHEAVKKGLFVEVYHEPMVETNIETILIPELKVAITASKKYKNKNIRIFDVDSFIDQDILKENEEKLKEDEALVDELLTKGLANMLVAKKEHDILETYYIPNMNFKEIDQFREKIMEKIMKYAKE
ncbi:PRK06851 family protein [Thermotalea metallivorans]|uniref:ATPase n=1 Tax=Thermotalea metallivorans TaxID=520762 RepID=A0A140LB51_9FIRM|nr:PRK06851 family protein [Thermotalea metallivorans]KXG77776.1 hypothetical protein AN619_03780 [Thermotalea metallivorans]